MSAVETAILVIGVSHFALILVFLAVLVMHERQRQAAADKWAKVLNELAVQHAEDLNKILTVRYSNAPIPVATNTPENEAIYMPREPDAQERLTREVHEATVNTGVEFLRERYRIAGIQRTDEELRREVAQVAAGHPYT